MLQEREVLRMGATTPVPVDVRVIAATHAELGAQVERGLFRRDLHYRLAVLQQAVGHTWPGNVRELENWVERLRVCQTYVCNAQGEVDTARLLEVFPECATPLSLAVSTASQAIAFERHSPPC